MKNPTGAWLEFINAIYWIGSFVGALVAAWVSNKYGRRGGIWLGVVLVAIGTALQTATPNDSAFIVARLIVGISSGFLNNAAPLLLNEIAYPTHRVVANASFMCGYYLGAVIAAWVIFGTRIMGSSWAWRIPSITQVACPILALPALLLVPESSRWLVSVGRAPEARTALADLHASGDASSPVVNHQMTDIQNTLEAEKEHAQATGYTEMLSTPGNRHRLFITFSVGFYAQWVGNVVVSYYLSLVLNGVGITRTRDQLLISGCLQIWNLIFSTVGTMSVKNVHCCSQRVSLNSHGVLPASPHGSGLSHITTPSGLSNMAMGTSPAAELPTMTIPLWHSTTTGSLISCPQVKSLLGDYPNDVFLRIEERRVLPAGLTLPSSTSSPLGMPVLDHAITNDLMEKYFQSVNMQHPILDYDECATQYHPLTSNPLEQSLESAFFLLMLAVAEVSGAPRPEALDADWSPGSTYFLPALTISVETYLRTSITTIVLPRCLYLAALYYNYLGRPLDAWKLVHMASTSFQRL